MTGHDQAQAIGEAVMADMELNGTFIQTNPTMVYYVPQTRDAHENIVASERHIYISKKSDELELFLCSRYELNPTEKECESVMAKITADVFTGRGGVAEGSEQVLSAYDPEEDALYLHTGSSKLLRITADDIRDVPNGHRNMVFMWSTMGDTFDPVKNGKATRAWWSYLFHDAVATIEGLEQEEATAILTAWFMFLLFRQLAASRPILTTIGAPGSGKTVLFKRIYAMLYGDSKSVSSITTPDNFDMSVASNPFVCFDNIDISRWWLPDRLALSAGVTDIEKRRLYTDKSIVLLRRHALVGMTSHNPEFTRSDVADRLLLITLNRWEHHLPEGIIMRRLMEQRDRLWGGVIQSVQAMLGTPLPKVEDAPPMRVQDFAYLGLWAARAVGQEAAFMSGMAKLARLQRTFALTEESSLVEALDACHLPTDWETAGSLFRLLVAASKDGGYEFRATYKNPAVLGRRLVALIHPLREFFTIERKRDHKNGFLWRIDRATQKQRSA